MKELIGCGTCKNHPEKKTRDVLLWLCGDCTEVAIDSGFKKLFTRWEDALPCCKNEKVTHDLG